MSRGAAGLLALAVIGIVLLERLWLRIVCAAFVALYCGVTIARIVLGSMPPAALLLPAALGLLALFVAGVKKTYGKW